MYVRGAPGPDGRALVLFHGAGGDRLFWGQPARLLGRAGIPTLALEFPGHGRSPGPPLESVSSLASAAENALAAAGARRWVVAGHSLGGAVALTLAAKNTAGLAAVAAVSCGAWLPVDPLVHRGTREAFACTAENLVRFSFPAGTSAKVIERGVDAVSRVGPAALYADLAAAAAYRLSSDDLGDVQVPAEMVCGALDRLTPPALSEELAGVLPNSGLTILAGVGHLPPLEAPGDVADLLIRLWRRVFPGG